jgi:hypothetical protein
MNGIHDKFPGALDLEGQVLWLRYFVECERYDRTLTRARDLSGDAQLLSPADIGESARHARETMKGLGLTSSRFVEERQFVSQRSTQQQEEFLFHLEVLFREKQKRDAEEAQARQEKAENERLKPW